MLAPYAAVGAVDPLLASIAKAGDAEVQREGEAQKARLADAHKHLDEFGKYVKMIPVYGTIAMVAFSYALDAFDDIGKWLHGDNQNSPENRDRAIADAGALMAYGRPPRAFDPLFDFWQTYAEALEDDIRAFQALPQDKLEAAQWLGQSLAKVQDDDEVLKLFLSKAFTGYLNFPPAEVGPDGKFVGDVLTAYGTNEKIVGLLSITRTDYNEDGSPQLNSFGNPRTYRHEFSLPFEPLLAATIAAKATGAPLDEVRADAIAAWKDWFANSQIPLDGSLSVEQSTYVNQNEHALMADRWGAIALAAKQSALKQRPMKRNNLFSAARALNISPIMQQARLAQKSAPNGLAQKSAPNGLAGPQDAAAATSSSVVLILLLGGDRRADEALHCEEKTMITWVAALDPLPLPTAETAATDLIKTGVLGSVLVLVGLYAFWVTRQWNKAQEDRVADQQKVTTTLVDFSTGMKDVLRDLKTAIDSLKAATDEERKAITVIDSALLEIDRTVDDTKKGVEQANKALDSLKTQSEDARRAHETIQRSVDDIRRPNPR